MRFKIVSASWNAEDWLLRCMMSIEGQAYRDFDACVVVDGSDDRSAQIVMDFVTRHDNFKCIINKKRGCTLKSQRQAIKALDCEPDDVIVWLDGDDAFSGPDSLQIIKSYYDNNPELLVTYGSYQAIPKDRGCAPSRPYPKKCVDNRDFRNVKQWGFQFNHLRTMKYKVYENIPLEYLSWPDGSLFTVGGDAAEMLCALEMAGPGRFQFISEILMNYTSNNSLSDWRVSAPKINKTHEYIQTLPKMDLL